MEAVGAVNVLVAFRGAAATAAANKLTAEPRGINLHSYGISSY